MSDDFDRQDDDFDWLGDDGDDDSESSSDSGFTGELSWLQDADDSPDSQKGRGQTDDLDLDWLNASDDDSGASASTDSTGVTGELSWLSGDSMDTSPDASKSDTDNLDWMQADDEDDANDVNETDDEPLPSVPDWLQDTSADDTDDIDDDAPVNEPSWLSDTGPLVEDNETDDSPDWLANVGDTGMLNQGDIDQALDELDDEDSHPSWLSDVGDTGTLNQDDIDQTLDEIDEEDAEPVEPDWLASMGIGESSEDETDIDDAQEAESPDWLSGIPIGDDSPAEDDDSEDALDLEGMFGFDDDEQDQYEPDASSVADDTSDEEQDTGWLEYQGDEEVDEYDPYAIYNEGVDEDEEYEDIFNTDTLSDGEPVTDNSLFDTSKQPSDLPSGEETPDWLADFDEEKFEGETGALAETPTEEPQELDADWLDEFDEDAFGGDTDALFEDTPADKPSEDTGWLDEFDEDDFEQATSEAPIPEDDPLNDVPDWLRGDIGDEGDTDALTPKADPEDFADAPEMSADDLLADLGIDPTPSTGLTGELDNVEDDFDMSMFDDLDLEDVTDSTSTGLTGELGNLDDDLLDEIDFDDLELDIESASTGLTGELGDLDDDLDMSFLDDMDSEDESDRVGTGLTGELSNLDDDLDMSFLDEVDIDDESEQVGTGLTGDLDEADEDMDLSFLDDVEVSDDAPDRVGTGLTGDLEEADEDIDLSFLDDMEDEPSATGLTGDLDEADEELDLSFLDDDEEDISPDWFAEPDDATDSEPDWMQTLSDVDIDALETEAQNTDIDDIFDGLDLEDMDFEEFEEDDIQTPAADLDSLLASYEDVEEGDFDIDNAESGIDDLDAIFDAALQEDTIEEDELPGDIPEWLRGIDVGDDETSAAAIIRQQDDKPLESLDDRLQALRERGISASAQAEDAPSAPTPEVLSDVGDTLTAPSIAHETQGIVSDINLTESQKKQADLLQQIVGVTITPTVETDEEGIPMVESSRSRRSLPKVGLGRLAVAVITLLVLILPFISNFGVGSLPPLAFGNDNQSANVVFNELENLNDGDYVLVGFEYGPTAAGELDSVADILLRHIVSQGAVPVIVSSNPVGVVHAQNIFDDINQSVRGQDLSLEPNNDYIITRYLTGGTLGLRDLSQNFESIININAQGDPTNLSFTSLDDMSLMLLIAERSDDIRGWAEQVVPSTTTRLVAATGYSAQPLAEPYVNQTNGILGLVVGYRDAYTYGEMLQAVYATATPAPTETFTPTFTPSNTPEPTNTPLPTDTPEATEDGDTQAVTSPDDETETDGGDTEPTDEPTATNTPEPTDTATPSPTATNTASPTNTPTNTATFTPTPRLITVIQVVSPGGSVNVRTGPSQNFPVLTTANDGDVYQVIGENDDGDWINFLLPDGREGWIAEFLVEQTELPETDFEEASDDEDEASLDDGVTVMRVSYERRMGKNQVRYYQAPEATASPTLPFETLATPDPRAGYVFSRDRSQENSRLNAITMGTIAAVVIILFGNIYFGLRTIIRRRRESKR